VGEHTTEVTCVPGLLDPVDLTGKIVTADAAHTCQDTADYLVNTRRADYALTVKGNRPHLLEAIAARMPRAVTGSAAHRQEEIKGGRRVVREIWVADAHGIDFPGAGQVFRIRRSVYDLSGNRISKDIVHGITSLPAGRAAADLLALVRDHWLIEANHWIRDVAWREDHQHTYTGAAAHSMAILRNLSLAILRLTGHRQIIRTLQRIAADRTRIMPILAAFPLPTRA
jgi:predicted transposase YbfD/YdcC